MGYEVRVNVDLSIAYFAAMSSILPHCQGGHEGTPLTFADLDLHEYE